MNLPEYKGLICRNQNGIIFECPTPHNGGVTGCVANAKAIHKAVVCHDELVEALEACAEFLDCRCDEFTPHDLYTKIEQALARAKEA